jgi:Fic family protein
MKELIGLENKYQKLITGDSFDYDKFNEFAVVHHSNSIEGSSLTKEETFLLLDEKLTPKNKPIEYSLMALDHLDALQYVMALAMTKTTLTVDTIKAISSRIMKNTGTKISAMAGDFDSSSGDFRKLTVRAGIQTFMDYAKVPGEVKLLVNHVNENITKITYNEVNNLAFDTHYQLVTIHPFADGNGRLARLLMNYVQKYHNRSLSIIYNEFKSDYFQALDETRKKGDMAIFRKFMYSQTKMHLKKRMQEIETQKRKWLNRSKDQGFSLIF